MRAEDSDDAARSAFAIRWDRPWRFDSSRASGYAGAMTRITKVTVLAAALLVSIGGGLAVAQVAGATAWTTDFRGPGMCLDVVNGGPDDRMTHLVPCGAFTGQRWSTASVAGGWSTLTTEFRGPGMCLDVINGGPLDGYTRLEPCGNFSGQHWHLRPEAGGAVRLTTEFRGEGMCLDVTNGGPRDGYTHLTPCGAFTGQLWHAQRPL